MSAILLALLGAALAGVSLDRTVLHLERTDTSWPHGAPKGGWLRQVRTQRRSADGGTVVHDLPLGAADITCQLAGARVAARGLQCIFDLPEHGGEIELTTAWTRAGLPSVGEHDFRGPEPTDRAELCIEGDRLALAALPIGAVREGDCFVSVGVGPRARDSLPSPPDPSVTWRVQSLAGEPVLPDRATALDRIAYAAITASMPEPALPVDFKNRVASKNQTATDTLVPDLLALVRRQVVQGALPGQPELFPRALMTARRSGFANPWEQALLLTRYLRQKGLDALPVPLRPLSRGPVEAGTPVGYDRAAVRLIEGTGVRWLDPGCAVCAPGELAPELWGALAFADGEDHLPDPPGGRQRVRAASLTRHYDPGGDGKIPSLSYQGSLRAIYEGTEALDLRRSLLRLDVSARRAALERPLGGKLSRLDGADEPGQRIVLQLDGLMLPSPLLPLDLPQPSAEGPPLVAVGGPFVHIDKIELRDKIDLRDKIELDGGISAESTPPGVGEVELPGLAWRGELTRSDRVPHEPRLFYEERLEVGAALVARADVRAFIAAVELARGELWSPARPAPGPAGSLPQP